MIPLTKSIIIKCNLDWFEEAIIYRQNGTALFGSIDNATVYIEDAHYSVYSIGEAAVMIHLIKPLYFVAMKSIYQI